MNQIRLIKDAIELTITMHHTIKDKKDMNTPASPSNAGLICQKTKNNKNQAVV
jgi:hypothetical protein